MCVDASYISMQSNLKNHHQCFSINFHLKLGMFNETIHPKWSFAFLELKFGMLDWDSIKI